MATSGSSSKAFTSWNTLKFSWSRTSYSVANNTSTISWKLELVAGSSGAISSSASKSYTITVNGTKYTGTTTIGISNNTTKTLASGTTTISHNADGTKTFSWSVSQSIAITFSGSSIGTVTFSGTGTLDTIPRASTLSVGNGTLGTSQTLTVTRHATSFTHTIVAKCGSYTSTIRTKSTDTSITFTPPLAMAAQNTTGTTLSVTYTITTYNGDTSIGSKSYTVTCTIPSSVKPSCTIAVSDPTGHKTTYGNYIRGLSKIKVDITPTTAQGASIKAYETRVNGAKYTGSSVTIDTAKYGTSITISSTVTDSRGRTSTAATATVTTLNYSPPTISKFAVKRCNSDGTENDRGENIAVTLSGTVDSMSSKNAATYTLQYKKSSENTYSSIDVSDIKNNYAVSNKVYVFSADTGSSYDVRVTLKDNFTTVTKNTSASTGYTIMHWLANGLGMAVGKIAELAGVFDIGYQTRFSGGILHPVLEPDTDLNDIRTPNTYIGANVTNYNYANCPVESGTFTLIVEGAGESGQVKQTYISCSKYKPERFSRFYYQDTWGDWLICSTDEVLLYENESGSNGAITLNYSVTHFRYIEIYYVDNNNKLGGYTKLWKPQGKTVGLFIAEAGSSIYYRQTSYYVSGTSISPSSNYPGCYTRINSDKTLTVSFGTNYIKIVRVVGRA